MPVHAYPYTSYTCQTVDQLRSEFEEAAKHVTLDTKKPSAFTLTLYRYALITRNISVTIAATLYNYTLGWVLPTIKPAPVMVPINHVRRMHGL